MKETWSFDRCVFVLGREIELLKSISGVQEMVRQKVMNREWADSDEKTEEVKRLGSEFSLVEEERVRLFSGLTDGKPEQNNEEAPFYAMIRGLPPEEQGALSRLYRELKMETMKMRALNENFLAYLNEAKNMAASYLEAVCPARSGRLYTRKGRKVSHDLRSIVFNSRF